MPRTKRHVSSQAQERTRQQIGHQNDPKNVLRKLTGENPKICEYKLERSQVGHICGMDNEAKLREMPFTVKTAKEQPENSRI